MKIGIFDSGVGGLTIAHAIMGRLPQYSYWYLGDTAHLPYGDKSPEEVYSLAKQAVDYLFRQDCKLIIIACNTISAEALRRLQQEYLPHAYPDRRILGVIVPTIEMIVNEPTIESVGVLATAGTVNSHAYVKEIHKLNPDLKVVEVATPLLVPLIENNQFDIISERLTDYLRELNTSDAIVLGCTHYSLVKNIVRELSESKIISQDEIIPEKLATYISNHSDLEKALTTDSSRVFEITAANDEFNNLAQKIFERPINIQLTHY